MTYTTYKSICPSAQGDLAAEIYTHTCGHSRGGQSQAKEIHQFGHGGLGGHIVARDDPAVGELIARGVTAGVYTTVGTLSHVDNHHSA